MGILLSIDYKLSLLHKRQRRPNLAGAAGLADAVNVVIMGSRCVEIDHVASNSFTISDSRCLVGYIRPELEQKSVIQVKVSNTKSKLFTKIMFYAILFM